LFSLILVEVHATPYQYEDSGLAAKNEAEGPRGKTAIVAEQGGKGKNHHDISILSH